MADLIQMNTDLPFEVGGARVQSGPSQFMQNFTCKALCVIFCDLLRVRRRRACATGARYSQGSTFGPVVSQQARCCVTDHADPVIQDVPGNGGSNPEDAILIEFTFKSIFKDLVSQDPYTCFLAGMITKIVKNIKLRRC